MSGKYDAEEARARTRCEFAESRVREFEAAAAALEAMTADPDDFDALLALEERKAATAAKVGFARKALAKAEADLASIQAQQAAAGFEAECAEAERLSAALAKKLEREWPRYVEGLRALASEVDADRQRTAELNRRRGQAGMRGVPDAEERLRWIPHRDISAVYGEAEEWRDEDGRRPSEVRPQPDGTARGPGNEPLQLVKVPVCIQPARFEMGGFPGGQRLADAIHLVDLAGKKVWPR